MKLFFSSSGWITIMYLHVFFHLLMKVWDRSEIKQWWWQLQVSVERKHQLDMNPSGTLIDSFFLNIFLPSFSYSNILLLDFLLSTTPLLPAWGRSMHVLYSGPVASSVPSPHLSFSLSFYSSSLFFCLCALSHSHTNKQRCLICRLFTFH